MFGEELIILVCCGDVKDDITFFLDFQVAYLASFFISLPILTLQTPNFDTPPLGLMLICSIQVPIPHLF